MKTPKLFAVLAFATAAAFAGPASAQVITQVKPICEVTPHGVETVEVRLMSYLMLEYAFKRLPNGPIHLFPATTLSVSRKFVLVAGSYQLSVKHPNSPAVSVYNQPVVVKPYQVSGTQCIYLDPFNRAERVPPLQAQ